MTERPPRKLPERRYKADILSRQLRSIIDPTHVPPRRDKDLLSYAQRQKIAENFAEQASSQYHAYYDNIADVNVSDIMLMLAKHGGSVEVRGFGTFYVRVVQGKWRNVTGPKPPGLTPEQLAERLVWQPPYRTVFFTPNKLMKDMLNLDRKTQDTATPNPDYWDGEKHLLF